VNTTIYHTRNHAWTGVIVRRAGDMTLVSWLTGVLAGEQKWVGTDNVRALRTPGGAA
jgi:hypothetical protein